MSTLKTIAGGFITAILLIGVLFKAMHWPGAGLMIVLGASSLSMYVILVAGIVNFSLSSSKKDENIFGSKSKLLSLSTSVVIIGLLFKIQHWPGAGMMLIVGLTSLALACLLYIYTFIVKKEEILVTPPLFFITIGVCALFFGVSASGVSYFVIKGISYNATTIESINHSLLNQNEVLIEKSTNKKIANFYKESSGLIEHISDLKSTLYQEVDRLPEEIADTISLSQIMAKDNYDIPTWIMGLSDPGQPIKVPGMEVYSAVTLRQIIEDYNEGLKEIDPKLEGINTQDYDYFDGQLEPWEVSTFYHAPLAFVILTLNRMQLEINVITNQVLTKSLLKATNNPSDTIN